MTPSSRPSASAAENPFFETWTTPFGAPPFVAHQARAFHAGLRARLRRARGRDRRDRRRRPSRRPSTTPSSRWRTPAAPCSASTTCSASSVGTDSNDTLLAIERDISPRTAAHWNKVRMNDGAVRAHRRALSASATASASPPSRRACWSAITPSIRREGAALDAGQEEAPRRDRRAAGGARHRVQPERAGRRAVLHDGARRRGRSRRPARFRARGGGRRGRRARHERQARHHPAALQRRAVPAILVAARSAREGVPRLDRARRQRRQDRQQGDHRRD